MINLLCLLCSLCIQFVAVGITPFDYSIWDNTGSPVYSGLEFLETLSGIDLSEFYYGYFSNGGYGFCYAPLNYFSDAYDDIIITYDSYIVDDDGQVIGYRVTMSNVRSFSWNSNGTYYYNDYIAPNFQLIDVYFRGYQPNNYNGWLVERLNVDYLPYILNNVVFVYNGVISDDDMIDLPSIGILDENGHSQGSPIESLNNFSWSAHSSTYTQSGHNTHVIPSSATPDFTNAEQNLLGQIVDNTNSIIENTNSLGSALETINGNIINGASAIFNAISQLNNNFISSYVYDEDEVDEALASSNMLLFVQTSNDFIYTMADLVTDFAQDVNQQEQIDELVIPIDLRPYSIVYFDTDGYILSRYQPFPEVYQMRFEFLDETKAIWQPLLIAILYFSLTMSIYFDLPNIIRGAVS